MISKLDMQSILKALAVFEEAARTSSFTKAAQALGMAQPSVSRFIMNLERRIGMPLFVRHHNRVELTTHGEQLYEATALGFGHIRAVLDELSATSVDPIITIGCTHSFAHLWVLPRLENLKSRLPTHDIRTMTSDQIDSFDVTSKQFVVRFGDGRWDDGQSIPLFGEEVYPVCSPGFASQYKLVDRRVSPKEIAELPLVVQDRGEFGWLSWSAWFSMHGVKQTVSMSQTINNYAFALQAAMEGKGIALAWHNLIEPYLSNGWLTKPSGVLHVRTNNGYYLVHSHNDPLADIVREWISDTA